MGALTVPTDGFALTGIPSSNSYNGPSKSEVKPSQVMQLQLPHGMLQDFLNNAQNGGKAMCISMGKAVTLHYGNKSQQLLSTPQLSRSELYSYATDKPNELAFTGLLSHKLDIQTAQENLAGTDSALATLQSQMASHQKDKQSKQIHFVPDGSNLPPPIQQKQATIKHSSGSLFKMNGAAGRLGNATTRSIPSSPLVGASRSSPNLALPSTPVLNTLDAKGQKLQALRTPIIHLLAVRPVSTKFLVQNICCNERACLEVLQKVGREYRLDSSKWDLSDKTFKELDIWKFPYPQDEDRQFAIERAVSAFDRLRLSREDKLWQMLLPKNERGQGKVLSKLNLHAGPIPKSGTPRIQVRQTDDPNLAELETSNESDRKNRLAPSDAEVGARSKPIKKKISEKEAQSKRLLSKNPQKAINISKSKQAPSDVKKVSKKIPPSTNSNIKSTEFVRDSDEDERMEDIQPTPSQPLPAKSVPSKANTTKPPKDQSKTSKPPVKTLPNATTKPKAPLIKDTRLQKKANTLLPKVAAKKPPSSTSSSGSRNRLSEASPSSASMTKSLSRQRTSSSPHKPSPLGSSPPTNASDFDNDTQSHQISSTSSTPLIAQSRKVNNAAPRAVPAATPSASRSVHNTSERDLKRKADDIDSDIHHHDIPLSNGNTNPAKRHKTSILSPPTSESSNDSNSPMISPNTLKSAQQFKLYYAKYVKQYREVSNWQDAPKEKVDAVLKMHLRLAAMKDEIAKSLIT